MNLNGRLSFTGNVSGSMGAQLVADVEANPSGTPSQTLVSIRVGDVIYSIPSGGGGGGTSDYNALNNKPKVNNVTLSGDLTLADLGIQPAISFPGDGSKYLDGNGSFSTPGTGAIDYSTQEQNTGLKWIDDKDIYTISIPFDNTSDVNYAIDVRNLNIDTLIICDLWCKSPGYQVNSYYNTSNDMIHTYYEEIGYIHIRRGTSFSGTGYLNIKYTKLS